MRDRIETFLFRHHNRAAFHEVEDMYRTCLDFVALFSFQDQIKYVDEHPELLLEANDAWFESLADANQESNPKMGLIVEQRRYLLRRAREVGITQATQEFFYVEGLLGYEKELLAVVAGTIKWKPSVVNPDTMLFLERSTKFIDRESARRNRVVLLLIQRCAQIGIEQAIDEFLATITEELEHGKAGERVESPNS
jgi:hypothetical protein